MFWWHVSGAVTTAGKVAECPDIANVRQLQLVLHDKTVRQPSRVRARCLQLNLLRNRSVAATLNQLCLLSSSSSCLSNGGIAIIMLVHEMLKCTCFGT